MTNSWKEIESRVKSRVDRLYAVYEEEDGDDPSSAVMVLPEGSSAHAQGVVDVVAEFFPQARRVTVFSGEMPDVLLRRFDDAGWMLVDVRTL